MPTLRCGSASGCRERHWKNNWFTGARSWVASCQCWICWLIDRDRQCKLIVAVQWSENSAPRSPNVWSKSAWRTARLYSWRCWRRSRWSYGATRASRTFSSAHRSPIEIERRSKGSSASSSIHSCCVPQLVLRWLFVSSSGKCEKQLSALTGIRTCRLNDSSRSCNPSAPSTASLCSRCYLRFRRGKRCSLKGSNCLSWIRGERSQNSTWVFSLLKQTTDCTPGSHTTPISSMVQLSRDCWNIFTRCWKALRQIRTRAFLNCRWWQPRNDSSSKSGIKRKLSMSATSVFIS